MNRGSLWPLGLPYSCCMLALLRPLLLLWWLLLLRLLRGAHPLHKAPCLL